MRNHHAFTSLSPAEASSPDHAFTTSRDRLPPLLFPGPIELPDHPLMIAVDTEYEGPHTLTIQFAMRRGDTIVVQVYRSPAILSPTRNTSLQGLPRDLWRWCRRVQLKPIQLITPDLSPAKVVADLLGITPLFRVSRSRLLRDHQPVFAKPVDLTMIAHFWPADFFRIAGSGFLRDLLVPTDQTGRRITIVANKLLSFREVGPGASLYIAPTLEYIDVGSEYHPVRVQTFDTSLPYGRGSLDDLAGLFLGIRKHDGLLPADKARMLQTFREKTDPAYRYAILDVVLTLLLEEQMRAQDGRMYRDLGFDPGSPSRLRPTLGSRVAEMIGLAIAKGPATGSALLSQKGQPRKDGTIGAISMAKIKALMVKGSGDFLAAEKLSKFGAQTAETHGGLLFSRSPTQFAHRAPGQFRDVDVSGCYNAILGQMKLYVGRPVIVEPGAKGMKLKDAMHIVQSEAASRDAWILKVSGRMTKWPNTLIPSTNGALTHANFQNRRAKQRAKSRRDGFAFDWMYASTKQTGNATLYTDVVEAGIVAWPTWLMIQALPKAIREEYERLEVETLIFYPEQLVATDGAMYDRLCEQFRSSKTPWTTRLDLRRMQQVTVETLDADYVSLEFGIDSLARQIGGFRQRAVATHGKGSGEELAWKQHANAMYGVCASRYLPTNNVVAANVITATARALAFGMQLALNGVQVITDGCTYRRDQVPAGTLADCLRSSPEYPIRRIEAGTRFLNPAKIPLDDPAFTRWYRTHVKRFFGTSDPAFNELFAIHDLTHKPCGPSKQTTFDGLLCDGSGNYMKLLREAQRWKNAEFKARSYGREAKARLARWLFTTYMTDRYSGPPPATETTTLFSYHDAIRMCRHAVRAGDNSEFAEPSDRARKTVLVPLGLESRKVLAYKAIKLSAFVFRTPEQREKVLKSQREFTKTYACGLELIALRRGHQGQRSGSLTDVATRFYDFIRAGHDNLTKAFNLTRSNPVFEKIRVGHAAAIDQRKRQIRQRLSDSLDRSAQPLHADLTGLFVSASDVLPGG